MPEIIGPDLELVLKSTVIMREQLGDVIVERFRTKARVVCNPADRIREPGEELVTIQPVLQVNPVTNQVSLT